MNCNFSDPSAFYFVPSAVKILGLGLEKIRKYISFYIQYVCHTSLNGLDKMASKIADR